MKAITFIPTADIDKMMWLNHFATKLPGYASSFGITATEVTSIQKDATAFTYMINLQEQFKQSLQQITAYKNSMKHAINQQHLGAMPNLPNISTAPPAVPEGIFDRVSKLVRRIKASPNYTDPIGNDLGIVSSSYSEDTQQMQPRLVIKLNAGHPHIKCMKGNADGLDLYVNRKDGSGFVFISRLFIMDYIDQNPLPQDNSIIEWDYKAMYVKGNDNVGLMSSLASVVVKKI
jgi:hypothetical protein